MWPNRSLNKYSLLNSSVLGVSHLRQPLVWLLLNISAIFFKVKERKERRKKFWHRTQIWWFVPLFSLFSHDDYSSFEHISCVFFDTSPLKEKVSSTSPIPRWKEENHWDGCRILGDFFKWHHNLLWDLTKPQGWGKRAAVPALVLQEVEAEKETHLQKVYWEERPTKEKGRK